MGWFFTKKEEFRLLDTRTPGGGVIFWVRDARKCEDTKFITDMVEANKSSIPVSFITAMESPGSNETLQVRFSPLPGGSCNVYMEYTPRDTKTAQDLAAIANRSEGPDFALPKSLKNTDL
jgi:hypothetical protein